MISEKSGTLPAKQVKARDIKINFPRLYSLNGISEEMIKFAITMPALFISSLSFFKPNESIEFIKLVAKPVKDVADERKEFTKFVIDTAKEKSIVPKDKQSKPLKAELESAKLSKEKELALVVKKTELVNTDEELFIVRKISLGNNKNLSEEKKEVHILVSQNNFKLQKNNGSNLKKVCVFVSNTMDEIFQFQSRKMSRLKSIFDFGKVYSLNEEQEGMLKVKLDIPKLKLEEAKELSKPISKLVGELESNSNIDLSDSKRKKLDKLHQEIDEEVTAELMTAKKIALIGEIFKKADDEGVSFVVDNILLLELSENKEKNKTAISMIAREFLCNFDNFLFIIREDGNDKLLQERSIKLVTSVSGMEDWKAVYESTDQVIFRKFFGSAVAQAIDAEAEPWYHLFEADPSVNEEEKKKFLAKFVSITRKTALDVAGL